MGNPITGMKESWRLALEDGTHHVRANIKPLLVGARLTITWDDRVISTGKFFALMVGDADLRRFEQNGRSFLISHRGWGYLGRLVLSMDGVEVGGSSSAGCPTLCPH